MSNLTTTNDILVAALKNAGEKFDGTSPFQVDGRMLDYVNRVYFEIICGGSTFVPELVEPWAWARASAPGVLVLQPQFDTSLGLGITLTHGSIHGTFAQAPSASLGSFGRIDSTGGRFLRLDGSLSNGNNMSDVYRIATHTAGSASFTLDLAWQGDSIASGGFKLAKLDYALDASVVRLVEPFRIFQIQPYEADGQGKVQGISPDELHRRFPLYMMFITPQRAPTHFAIVNETSGIITVRFNTSTVVPSRTEYEYVPMPDELTLSGIPANDPIPILPLEHRSVLAMGATYWLMVDKEDPRADLYFRNTQQKLQSMLMERRREYEDESKDFARLNPRQDHYWRPYVRSTSGVRYP